MLFEMSDSGDKTMLEMTKETVGAAYEALKTAVLTAYEAGEAAIMAKNALEAMRLSMMMTGEIDGKNEAQREARARQLLEEKYDAVEFYEAGARRAKIALEVARLDVEMVRAQLRLAELVEASAA
jgi:hypothetical protein